jgi:hypothetical protein
MDRDVIVAAVTSGVWRNTHKMLGGAAKNLVVVLGYAEFYPGQGKSLQF